MCIVYDPYPYLVSWFNMEFLCLCVWLWDVLIIIIYAMVTKCVLNQSNHVKWNVSYVGSNQSHKGNVHCLVIMILWLELHFTCKINVLAFALSSASSLLTDDNDNCWIELKLGACIRFCFDEIFVVHLLTLQ